MCDMLRLPQTIHSGSLLKAFQKTTCPDFWIVALISFELKLPLNLIACDWFVKEKKKKLPRLLARDILSCKYQSQF